MVGLNDNKVVVVVVVVVAVRVVGRLGTGLQVHVHVLLLLTGGRLFLLTCDTHTHHTYVVCINIHTYVG